jgi:hypothetical protein
MSFGKRNVNTAPELSLKTDSNLCHLVRLFLLAAGSTIDAVFLDRRIFSNPRLQSPAQRHQSFTVNSASASEALKNKLLLKL